MTSPEGAPGYDPTGEQKNSTATMNREAEQPKETEARKIETFLQLPEHERAAERVRLVNEMFIRNIDNSERAFVPVTLVGNQDQAEALLDLVRATTPKEETCYLVDGSASLNKSLIPLFDHANVQGGMNRESTVVVMRQEENNNYMIEFGHAKKGTGVRRNRERGGLEITNNEPGHEIAKDSCNRLFELTGNIQFLQIAANIEAPEKQRTFRQLDNGNHYNNLGLNPMIAKSMPENVLEAMINAMKKGAAKELHSDKLGAKANKYTEDRLKKIIESANFLLDKDKRDAYANQ
ncbi:hypothetical protein ACFL2B_02845 [Patescibacteria group bacterium]